jgi:hypothetical protein
MTMTMEIGDISLMFTLTEAQENPDEETVTVTSIPVETPSIRMHSTSHHRCKSWHHAKPRDFSGTGKS